MRDHDKIDDPELRVSEQTAAEQLHKANEGDFLTKAQSLVQTAVLLNWPATDERTDFDVYVVWFAYTLGNWKALVSTTIPDNKYYEVTYNVAKSETYVDSYLKVSNLVVPD